VIWFLPPPPLINRRVTKTPIYSFTAFIISFPLPLSLLPCPSTSSFISLQSGDHHTTTGQPDSSCSQSCTVCECEREKERVRELLQTRSINSSNGFDPSRLTAAINIRASLPCLPTSHTTSHGGGWASACAQACVHAYTQLRTWKNRGRSNVLLAVDWKMVSAVTYVPQRRSTLVCPLLLF